MSISTRFSGLLIVILLMPAVALAQGQGHGHGKSHGDRGGDHHSHMERMAEKLELSQAQQEQWRGLHESHHPRMKQIRDEMREQRRALREASRDGFDEEAAESAAERLGELTRESSLMKARMHAEVRGMLTDEQRERFDQHHMKGKRGHEHSKHQAGERRESGEREGRQRRNR